MLKKVKIIRKQDFFYLDSGVGEYNSIIVFWQLSVTCVYLYRGKGVESVSIWEIAISSSSLNDGDLIPTRS